MFPLNSLSTAGPVASLADIASQYEVLHFYDGPVLFTGVNAVGSRVLGSLLERDSAAQIARFMHVLVPPHQFAAFLRRSVSYLEILTEAESIFVVDRAYDSSTQAVYVGKLADIPASRRPLANSFCPPREVEGSLEYVSVLDGPKTSQHRADAGTVSVLTGSVTRMLKEAVRSIYPKEMFDVDIALKAASFDITFSIQMSDTFVYESYRQYVQLYLDFCINRFHAEATKIAHAPIAEAPFFEKLKEIRNAASHSEPDDGASLVSSIARSMRGLDEIGQLLNQQLTSVTLYTPDMTLVGVIDKTTSSLQEIALDAFDAASQDVTVDATEKTYEIFVYSLNKESRKGSAYVLTDSAKTMPRARIEIQGTESLDESPYTTSIDKSVRITAHGIATKKNGAVVKLLISSATL